MLVASKSRYPSHGGSSLLVHLTAFCSSLRFALGVTMLLAGAIVITGTGVFMAHQAVANPVQPAVVVSPQVMPPPAVDLATDHVERLRKPQPMPQPASPARPKAAPQQPSLEDCAADLVDNCKVI